ncbi:MAG: RhuM family protein, partial [bacterium]
EDQAKRRKQVFLRDWETKLDEFLAFNERRLLPDAGKVSKEKADARAEAEYEEFSARRRAFLEAEEEASTLQILEEKVKRLPTPRPTQRPRKRKA